MYDLSNLNAKFGILYIKNDSTHGASVYFMYFGHILVIFCEKTFKSPHVHVYTL